MATVSNLIDYARFTPTERALLEVFSDGETHTVKELMEVLDDPTDDRNVLQTHLCRIRTKLEYDDLDILCKMAGRHYKYMLVRTLRVRSGE